MRPEDYHARLVYQSEAEELANRLTHGFGALLGTSAATLLVHLAALGGDTWRIVSCAIYGVSLITFYSLSAIYHTVRRPHIKYYFRILDHVSIYLMIAGSYTPFTLVSLRGPWGWSIFGVVWGLALAGTVFKAFMTHRLRILGPIFYIALGWLAMIAAKPLYEALSPAGFWWLAAGGLFYTVGVAFYAWEKLPYNHAIWHCFVLAGSACHYFAILLYVLPPD